MPTSPSPGEVAYAAWWYCRWPLDDPPHLTPYADLRPGRQAAWEAAAQAVLVQWWQQHEHILCGEQQECLTLDLDPDVVAHHQETPNA